MTMSNISAGFRVTGIYLFNRNALVPKPINNNLAQKTGLKYIPVLSPRLPKGPSRYTPVLPPDEVSEFSANGQEPNVSLPERKLYFTTGDELGSSDESFCSQGTGT